MRCFVKQMAPVLSLAVLGTWTMASAGAKYDYAHCINLYLSNGSRYSNF